MPAAFSSAGRLLHQSTVDFASMWWLPVLFGAYYLISGESYRWRDVAVMVLAPVAAIHFLEGATLLLQTNERWQQGRALNPTLGRTLVQLTLAAAFGLPAAWLAGWLRRKPPKYLTVPGVVTSVQSIEAGGKVHWRVGFAYFAADGNAYESVDELYVGGFQPQDHCTVVYPPEQPELGTLQRVSHAPTPPRKTDIGTSANHSPGHASTPAA